MPIRTYIEKICRSSQAGNPTSQGGYEWIEVCYEVEKPIPDWNISPATILKEWHPSQPIPSTENLTVHYPELGLLTVYKKYKGFRYYAHIAANEYVELIAPTGEDLENLIGLQHNLQLRYNNFSKLPEKGDVKVKVTLGVIATEEKSGKVNEIDLPTERKEIVITLRRTQESGSTPSPKPAEREVLRMTLNHATRELTGDKEITFIPIINSPFSFIRDRTRRLFLSAFPSSSHTFGEKKSEVFDIGLFKIQTYTSSSLDRIVFQLSDTYLRTGRVDEGGIDFTKPQILRWQNNSVFYSSRFSRKYFDIELTVINDTTAFHIDKKEFKYLLKTDKKERAEGVFTIKNPNLLTFTINNADFLEVTEVKGNGEEEVVVKFRSQSSELMTVGEHKGWLKVTSSAGSEQIVQVLITVQTDITFTAKKVYFCLDKELTHIRQTDPQSEFISVAITMEFNGYGRSFTTTQSYDYVFFEGVATVDIGQEVQDFFRDITPSLEVNTKKLLSPKEIFKATKVSAEIKETNFKGVVFKTHTLTDLHYLPGKKPKAYPYLTQSRLRSTYKQSLISVSALTQEVRARSLGQIGSNLIDLSAIKDPLAVANFSFLRATADVTYGATTIIRKETLSLEPKPEPNGTPISALFQNQNFCPDWFSFAGEYEALVSYEHTLADNVLLSEDYKAQVKTKRTYKLNTGWLFPEEIEVLWELIKSPVCFLRIAGEWLKVIPITQKPLSFDSTRNLHSFVVEFQLSSND
ncbi:hypothetical protein [uncultured Capnocytophaga sp.]|uniref:hypothetical protein n=1 Tax=uncultured Capnocytophaga sp. TaxID=159273 RepID=UPI002594AB7F|nr:hypothetical protein [uncultured Capnocytophaga sp.]